MSRTPWFAAVVFLAVSVAGSAQIARDVYISGGQQVPITIAGDRIGLLAREGKEGQTREFAVSLKLEVVREYRGGLFILALPAPRERAKLVSLARDLRRRGADFLAQAGLVVSTPDVDGPVVLTDEFIVGFNPKVSKKEIDDLNGANGVEVVMFNPFVKNQVLLRVTDTSPMDSLGMANSYLRGGLVEYAYPNFINVFHDDETIPNDPLFGDQWHHRNTGQGGGTVDADTDTSWAWDITRGATGTLIAVIENGGFDLSHPDLTPNLWTNPGEMPGNNVDDDGNGFVDDVHGWDFAGCASPATIGCGDNNSSPSAGEDHGTAVAGVAAARGNNLIGVSGSCPNCSLILLRTGYSNSDWAKSLAFGYAQQAGARIMTNSWGGGGAMPNTIAAINAAAAAGVVVLFAAGNTTSDVCTGAAQDPRVSLPDVVAVSSTTNQDRKVAVSAVGNCVDVLAPSHRGYAATDPYTGTLNITTTDRTGTNGYNNTSLVTNCPTTEAAPPPASARDYTACFGGTSSATPLTAGIVGLILTVNPTLSRVQVQRLLQDTTDKVEDSAGAYALSNGFSSPATGSPTHAFGRVNAFEAVQLAAPIAQGGKGGVDILLRDNRLDWGNTEQRSNTLFEATRGFIGHWRSVDIKVDAPPYQTAPTATTFDSFVDETPSAHGGDVNRAYVRVRNRGPVTAVSVTVKLHWSQFGTALAALPSDFWTAFPANSSNTSKWHPLNCSGGTSPTCTISNVAYSGSSVAGTAADAAQIVQFEFPAPAVDPSMPNHFCLLAMVDSPQDPISNNSKAIFVVDQITPTDNNVTHRNYANLPTDASDSFSESFFVRNPYEKAMRSLLRFTAPRGWTVRLDKLEFGTPFDLAPGQETLVTATVNSPTPGARGEVTILQDRLEGPQTKVLGGVTLGFLPRETGFPVSTIGNASSYLIGTFDLREGRSTLVHLVNPTVGPLLVQVAFFDDNENALRCVRERLSADDLLELDVGRLKLGALFGVVKVLAFAEKERTLQVGIVGNQRLLVKGLVVSETALHAVQPELGPDEWKVFMTKCK